MSNKKEKILLIDGYSIASRAYFGIPPLTNYEGLHTNAIMGFLNIFLNAYEQFKPDYVIVAFDVKEPTFRHKLFSAYKGTRKPMPAELTEQIPVLKDVLHSMGIRTAELPGYEADDIIGTYACLAGADGNDVVILSGDRDLLQLATDTAMVAIPKTKGTGNEVEHYFAKDVEEKYGVTPMQFIDMKALMGDSSDNIPGIPGIGEKTASAIISKYKSLENAYAHVEEITPNKARTNLQEFIEQGRMSRVLAEINVHSPVEEDYHLARVESADGFYNEESYNLFKRLELNKLLTRFDVSALNQPKEVDYTWKDAEEFVPEEGPAGLFIARDASFFAVMTGGTITVYRGWSDRVMDLMRGVNDIYCFGLKDILHAVQAERFRSDHIFDLEIMAYLLNPLNTSYSYDNVSQEFRGIILPSEADLLGKLTPAQALAEKEEECAKMAAYCVQTAVELFAVLKEKLEEEGMWDLFLTIEMPLTYSLYNMEAVGIRVERKRLNDFSAQLETMAEELQKEIYEDAGLSFNINSPQQLGNVLFEKLMLPHAKKTKKGYSTSADVLEKLAGEFPIVSKVLKYRQVVKLRSTYAEGLVNFIREDGRIHGQFNQTVTATGRISSTEPNLQNIPIRMELGQEIRRAFVAGEGCVFLDADYSQIELRLMAHLSDDKNLIEAYYGDADIHKITASKVFHIPLDEVTKEQRRNAKAVNFGIIYGISSFGLSQDLSISRKDASDYIKQYFASYPQVKQFLDTTVRRAKIDGYTTTMFGRRRPIPELASSNFMTRSFGERAAMNSPIQGSAADIMKIAMIRVERALEEAGLKARIVLQVHDELLVETPENEIGIVREILEEQMKHAARISVPLEVDVEEGRDWFEAH